MYLHVFPVVFQITYQVKIHAIIRPSKVNSTSFLSSKYPGHVKISLMVPVVSIKVGFQIYIPSVYELYLIDLLRSRSPVAAE